MALNRRLPPVRQDQFAMVSRPDVPRSRFSTRHTHKTTMDQAALVPIYVDEVLPGDDFRGRVTAFVRMATPLFPIMDNIHCEMFFFFTPCRLVWTNWRRFMGERPNISDTINFTIPQVNMTNPDDASGFPELSVGDYFGLPIQGELVAPKACNALPFRAYNLIWNEWFRAQQIAGSLQTVNTGDGPDTNPYPVLPRYKRHDYFTSSLPWPTQADVVPALPLAGQALVRTVDSTSVPTWAANQEPLLFYDAATGVPPGFSGFLGVEDSTGEVGRNASAFTTSANMFPANLYADLSTATGATLNAIRLAVATQQLLERDARGGVRYTELLRSHFGVMPQDMRLQRPEYIGGGKFSITTQAIPQTSAQVDDGTPLGELGGATTGSGPGEFSYAATEHGYIIGLANIYGDITYQRGVHRMFSRSTRYDFYWPTFAFLGEQAIRNDELYADGSTADTGTFAYQERWAEYRYRPGKITGRFRSNSSETMDLWHLAQDFTVLPTWGGAFLVQNTPISRVVAASELASGQQFIWDSVFEISCTRAVPMRSTPGLTRF